MAYHPDQHFIFNSETSKQIRSAINQRSGAKLIHVLERYAAEPDQVAAIAATLRTDDHLICLHADARRESKRDTFLADVLGWAEAKSCSPLVAALEKIIDQTAIIEAGYRLISRSIDELTISSLSPERQLAALLHHAATEFDEFSGRDPQFLRASDGSFSMGSPVVVKRNDGGYADVDSFTASLAELLGNAIEYLAYGRWSATKAGIHVPLLPEPRTEEISDADRLLVLSLSWTRWQRWERQARYWDGTIRRFDGPAIPPDNPWVGLSTLYEHARGDGDYFDWMAVERLKQLHAQDNYKLIQRGVADQPLESTPLPPSGFVDRAERLGANLVFSGAHLDPGDETTYGGATLNEWLRGYAVLRRIAREALDSGKDAEARHLVRLDRASLSDRLCSAGISPAGAGAFITGTTFRAGSIDLFDTPLIRQGDENFLLFGPAAANTDGGRTLLSNLPNLGVSLDHKGQLFENEVATFFRALGFDTFTPSGWRLGEQYQYDAVVVWESKLFVFECKNTAPSNLHPKIALDFYQRRVEDVRQVNRLVAGLHAHPDLLTDDGGPDPSRLTIVPVLLYAMPLARSGAEEGVLSTDWSMLGRFFERGDLGSAAEFSTGEGRKPLTYRQITQRIWAGDRPTPEDLTAALEDPWALRLNLARTRLSWVYTSLAPYQMARSVDFVAVDLSRSETAELYGIDERAWQEGLRRTAVRAARIRRRRWDRAVLLETRQGRRNR